MSPKKPSRSVLAAPKASAVSGNLQHRTELKFLVNRFEYNSLKSILSPLLEKDPFGEKNGSYRTRSLYFDDLYDSALYQKLSGVDMRRKYRIRIYNNSDSVIRLERKGRNGTRMWKESIRISRNLFDRILNRKIDALRDAPVHLLKCFYVAMKTRLLNPVVIVEYKREAYMHRPSNTRISFDGELKAGIRSKDLFDRNMPKARVLDDSLLIMELKYSVFIPLSIVDIFRRTIKQHVAISKYALCRRYGLFSIG